VVAILTPIYEAEFLGFSYGFRPGRGQHDALDALAYGINARKINWVLDADISRFFDTLSREWLISFVEHRIGDRRIIRLIQKWLKAGVLEDGRLIETTEGTPQGSVASPLLANVYLHYVYDLWVEQWRTRHARGDMIVVRYADDSVPRTRRRKEARNCVRDGGRSSGAGRQGQASNHRKLRRSKAGVVSVAEKAGLDPVRYGSERRARANR
jgi:RNA-directed DNA polymerase